MSDTPFRLGEDVLTTATMARLAHSPSPKVVLTPEGRARIESFRAPIDRALRAGKRVYGINTGFGFLADVAIADAQLRQLQLNLVRSHACGVGEPIAETQVRALLILRAHTFALGHSGVRPELVDMLLSLLAHDILPLVPCQGSVGASGDLAPLAHLALALLGEGEVHWRGERMPAAKALAAAGLAPLALEAKEGLALINGTHFMASLGALAVEEAWAVLGTADIAAALSLDAMRGTLVAFDERVQAVRRQPGQAIVAANVRALLAGKDEIMESHKDCGKIQDPYSLRCVPQVHGAVRDAVLHVQRVIEGDLNSVTDNPLVTSEGELLSGGNFHGEPLAMALDYLAIALAEIGSISERRTEKITNPHLSGLPAFATKDSGLNSGFMIPHVVAAALVSENKVLCHPASVDSIPTSADKEDHVSMGPISARKALSVLANVRRILAIELLAAAQGVDLLAPLAPSPALKAVMGGIRVLSERMDEDRSLHQDTERVAVWIRERGPVRAAVGTGAMLA